ncbi:MAG: hypothetical protein NT077_00790 [Candidatus Taylorbacteria bacterium]|nr:hypothetical protein [Candidatus Taylorbacteria bacterium]
MFFAPNDKHKLILILEIQSSLVCGSLVLSTGKNSGENPPRILFSQTLDVPYKPSATTTYYLNTTIRDLKGMIESLLCNLHRISRSNEEVEIPRHISEVHYVLSSPWIVSQARTISVPFKENTVITEEKINKILVEERQNLGTNKRTESETIEEKIFDVRLNGYSIAEWHNREARELEVAYALSIGGKNLIKKLTDLAEASTHSKKIHFHSALLLRYTALRNLDELDDSYTLIHVHGELTDLVVVRKRACSFFGSFPLGINTIIRRIAEVTNTEDKTAESLLSLYLGNHIDESHEKKVSFIMNNQISNWANELGKLWKSGTVDKNLPKTVFIISKAHEDFFARSFHTIHPHARIGKLPMDTTSSYAKAIYDIM